MRLWLACALHTLLPLTLGREDYHCADTDMGWNLLQLQSVLGEKVPKAHRRHVHRAHAHRAAPAKNETENEGEGEGEGEGEEEEEPYPPAGCTCTDNPPNWHSKENATCAAYDQEGFVGSGQKWCSRGHPDPMFQGWIHHYGNLNGVDAMEACCICGGGTLTCKNGTKAEPKQFGTKVANVSKNPLVPVNASGPAAVPLGARRDPGGPPSWSTAAGNKIQGRAADTQDVLVDAVENAEAAEVQRATFRALAKLRAAVIKDFDVIATLQTHAIDEYNDKHHYREENPLTYLHHTALPDALPIPEDKFSSFHSGGQ